MTLMRFERPELNWTPLRQLSTMREEMLRLLESPYFGLTTGTQPFMGGGWPAVDVYEDGESVYVRAEIPGMQKSDIDISLHEGVLSISGERKAEASVEGAETHRAERFVGRFNRSVTLPAEVNADKCNASYKDGILTVVLPKAEEAKPKQIQVQFSTK